MLGIAAKYAWRHRGRTLLIAFVVALGNFVMLFQLAQGAGQQRAFVDGMIGTLSGHLQVHARDARERDLFSADIEDATPLPRIERLEQNITSHPEVAATTRRIRFPAMMSHGNDSWGSFVIGVQPDGERRVSTGLKLGSGRFLRNGEDGIVISHDIAQDRGIALGDELVLLGGTVDGSYNGMASRVVGILSDEGLGRFYSSMAYVPIDRAARMIGLEDGQAYDLVVRLRANDQTDAVATRLRRELATVAQAPLDVRTWRDTGEIFHGILKVGDAFRAVMAIVLGVVVSVLVFSSLSVFVHERSVEISTMQAIGYRRRQLLTLFVGEGMFVTAAAAVVGLAAGAVAVAVLGRVGIPAFNEAMTYVFAGDRLYPALRLADVAALFTGTLAVAFVASLLPALRAAGSDPSRALNRS